MKTSDSIGLVKQLMRPVPNFGRNQEERRAVINKYNTKSQKVPACLRRTSSALMTKYSRKFKSNVQV